MQGEDVVQSFYDISVPLSPDTLIYDGDPPVRVQPCFEATDEEPNSFSISLLEVCTHSGTHLDPPRHFFPQGETVDQIDPRVLCGRVRVLDLRGCGKEITADLLKKVDLRGVRRLLLRTDNEKITGSIYQVDHVHLLDSAARYLVENTEIRLVGIDYLSIERGDADGFPVHHTLLGADLPVYILEGIDLRDVPEGDYTLACLPLKILGGDGAPVRAVLFSPGSGEDFEGL